jgi:tripartite-type tricarboxylate transporter receptor subunit TctC
MVTDKGGSMDRAWRSGNTEGKSRAERRLRLVHVFFAAAAAAMALGVTCVHAESGTYPDRPISIVVPYTPGSATDILARIVASELTVHLGQNVMVENKPGAGGSIGTTAVARAKNDGYTLCVVSTATMGINPALYRSLPYDPLKDFTPVIKLASTPNILLVPAQSRVTSAQDLLRRMKQKEKVFQYNSGGNGTTQHLTGVLLVRMAGANADHVPYRGPAEAVTALFSAQVDFGFQALPAAVSAVKSGRLRALGITSSKPSAALPDVPSLSAAGLEGFDKTDVWFGIAAPKDTPDALVQILHGGFVKTLSNPAIQAKLAGAGFDPAPPAAASEFAQLLRDQVAFWADLVKASGASVD